jgi:kynurenine formamidase
VSALEDFVSALTSGSIRIVDLTQPLHEGTPTIQLPAPFVNTPGFSLEELSRYDERGPAWYWNAFKSGEHVGTHLDAPNHWISGKDLTDVSQIPLATLVGPAAVIDRSADVVSDPDFLLTVEHIREWEGEHGPLPEGGWLLYRTGWDARAHDQTQFINADEHGAHTPGIDPDCARWLAEEATIVGVGVETVGTDAGAAPGFEPAFPCHYFLLGAGKLGLTQLANLAELPPTGSVLVVAPLKISGGSGSPARAFAFLPL